MNRQNSQQLDTFIRIVTPENVSFNYQLAGPFIRVMAFLIDFVIISTLIGLFGLFLMLGTSFFDSLSGYALGIWLIFIFVITWFYGGFLETCWNGQTVGKKMMRIRVLTKDGQPINSFQAVFRNILRLADLQPGLFGTVGICFVACTERFQRFGDLICGTIVITEDTDARRHELVKFKHPEVIRLSEQIPKGMVLSPSTMKALALYVSRRRMISPRRRDSIAAILVQPLAEKVRFPRNVSPDILLCAIYHASFVAVSHADTTPKNSEQNSVPQGFLPPISIED